MGATTVRNESFDDSFYEVFFHVADKLHAQQYLYNKTGPYVTSPLSIRIFASLQSSLPYHTATE